MTQARKCRESSATLPWIPKGWPHAIAVTTANITDRKGALAALERGKKNLKCVKSLPKRWIVERSFAWLEKCRRLWKNGKRKPNCSLQFVYLAFWALRIKRLRTGSWATQIGHRRNRYGGHAGRKRKTGRQGPDCAPVLIAPAREIPLFRLALAVFRRHSSMDRTNAS